MGKLWMFILQEGILESVDSQLLELGHTCRECERDFVSLKT